MSQSEQLLPATTPDPALTDREILESIYASQLRAEMLVQEFIESVRPTIETFAKGGLMGLFGR